MTRTADVAIVGGGIIGASVAYHLAALGVPRVVVFEREEILGAGSTGKCAGGVRLQFSSEANVEMSRQSILAFERFEDEHGVVVDFKRTGYLFVLGNLEDYAVFRNNAERQRALGVPVELLTPAQAQELVPMLNTDDLVGATFCGGDGIANPHAILEGYAKHAKRLGVQILKSVEVTSIDLAGDSVVALDTNQGRWQVGHVVNAAGPWARQIGAMAGIDIPVEPVRRQYFVTKPMDWIPDPFPLLIDWSTGCYMHKESGGMLVGESDPDEPPGFGQQVDWDFLGRVAEHGSHRVPLLAEAEVLRGVAGLYEVSPDHNAIIGAPATVPNFICANGFSGHGMQHAPAAGKAVAELVAQGESTSISLDAYAFDRFAREQMPEFNVI